MKNFNQSLSIFGTVESIDLATGSFMLCCRSDDKFHVILGPTTGYSVLANLDRLNRERFEDPAPRPVMEPGTAAWYLCKYIIPNAKLIVRGIYQEHDENRTLEARTIILPHWRPDAFLFEETHWWIDQISLMADKWLDSLFSATRSYKVDDFSQKYRTQLNISSGPTNDTVQECATLSRLIYGLSSAYLLTGSERYLNAAEAGIEYQREAFRSLSNDGEYCFWAFGRRPGVDGSTLVMPSENDDDRGTIPLYEQIYALAGLSQYFRITRDMKVLSDISRTINAFLAFYHDGDKAVAKGFPGFGGFFSHVDYATMRPDTAGLKHNQARKNWNSIGDHIPAYLVNILLSLDPPTPEFVDFQETCLQILDETSTLIIDKFHDETSDYVNERFHADWTPDHDWQWQKNRAIVGHNLKISWNLARVSFYYDTLANEATGQKEQEYRAHAARCRTMALDLGKKMAICGLDMLRGGVFDAVERQPAGGKPVEFSWGNTKDFWQQEQGILAYLILHGLEPENPLWLELARETEMFWNAFFLDHDRQGIFFRTTDNGQPEIGGGYSSKGGHSISGYHAFELAYLAHLYTRTYITNGDNEFCLYFSVKPNHEKCFISVLPDFFPPKKLTITRIRVNGIDQTRERKPASVNSFQIAVDASDFPTEIAVTFALRSR